jgi:hypothetical protein
MPHIGQPAFGEKEAIVNDDGEKVVSAQYHP